METWSKFSRVHYSQCRSDFPFRHPNKGWIFKSTGHPVCLLLLERGNWTIWIPLSIFSIHLIFIFSSILFLVHQHSLNVFHKMSFATTTNNSNNFLRFHYYYFHQLSCNRNLIPGVAQSQSIYYPRKNSGFMLSLLPCPLVPLPQVCKTWR